MALTFNDINGFIKVYRIFYSGLVRVLQPAAAISFCANDCPSTPFNLEDNVENAFENLFS